MTDITRLSYPIFSVNDRVMVMARVWARVRARIWARDRVDHGFYVISVGIEHGDGIGQAVFLFTAVPSLPNIRLRFCIGLGLGLR
jgi:hypothetical protein